MRLLGILLVISLLALPGCAPGISEADYNRVLGERDQARTQVASLQNELSAAEEKAAALEEKVTALEEETAILEEKVTASEEEIATLEEKLAALLPALSLEITSPEDGATVSESLVSVSGTVSDPEATITVNDVEVEVVEDGTFSADIELTEGENIITVVATLGEETATKTLTVTYTPSE